MPTCTHGYTRCLLDLSNPHIVNNHPISEVIRNQGKEHLWDDRPVGMVVDTIVLHSVSICKEIPADPFNPILIMDLFARLGVSSHYLIERNGHLWELVPPEKKAWHAGASIMPEPDCRKAANPFSIGIELIATEESGFTGEQYTALEELLAATCLAFPEINYLVRHEDIAGVHAVKLGLRSEPKVDPGPLFDWNRVRSFFQSLK